MSPSHIPEIEVGKCYYFMVHVYHHFIGEVVAVTGRNSCIIKNCVRVQSSTKNWTDFFATGCSHKDSNLTWWPDKKAITFFDVTPWNHKIPENPNVVKR